jgi:hypothetical protein
MHDLVLVTVHDSRKYLTNYFCSQLFCENSIVNNLIEEFSTLAILGDEIEVIMVLEIFMQSHDVRMFLLIIIPTL